MPEGCLDLLGIWYRWGQSGRGAANREEQGQVRRPAHLDTVARHDRLGAGRLSRLGRAPPSVPLRHLRPVTSLALAVSVIQTLLALRHPPSMAPPVLCQAPLALVEAGLPGGLLTRLFEQPSSPGIGYLVAAGDRHLRETHPAHPWLIGSQHRTLVRHHPSHGALSRTALSRTTSAVRCRRPAGRRNRLRRRRFPGRRPAPGPAA